MFYSMSRSSKCYKQQDGEKHDSKVVFFSVLLHFELSYRKEEHHEQS